MNGGGCGGKRGHPGATSAHIRTIAGGGTGIDPHVQKRGMPSVIGQ